MHSQTYASVNFLTRFERVQLLNVRAEQLLRGAPPCVPVTPLMEADVWSIAEAELRAGTLPLLLERRLPNGVREKRRLRDLLNMASSTGDATPPALAAFGTAAANCSYNLQGSKLDARARAATGAA
jgi:DNA-directed RNA polymerase subunit K/omega